MAGGQKRTLLKVASLNTWHGLNGQGTFFFGQLESRAERMARLDRQITCLQSLNADVLLLQEVNPLPFRAHWYADKLSKRVHYVSCNSGIKLGWGPPGNLNEGVAVLFPQDWEHEFLGRKRLSGSLRLSPFRIAAITGPFLSFQLHESRVACAIRLNIPPENRLAGYEGRNSVLLCVTHLHVAHALTPRNEELLQAAQSEGHLTDAEVTLVKKEFRIANTRRLTEVDELASWLEELRLPDEPMLLAGDFNCEPESPPYNALLRRGWQDLWIEAGNSTALEDAATWDAPRNTLTSRVKDFQHQGAKDNANIAALLQKADALPRRIDFLFGQSAKSNPSSKKFQLGALGQLHQVKRFGFLSGNPLDPKTMISDDFTDYVSRKEFSHEPRDDLKFISDHHGLCAEFGM